MRHNVVANLALFFALSGTAIAARPLLTGADVQNESLTGVDVQNDSLTGDDVLESSLGKVGDADTLDGLDSTAFGTGFLTGRINTDGIQQAVGAVSGVTNTPSTTVSNSPYATLAPNYPSELSDLSVKLADTANQSITAQVLALTPDGEARAGIGCAVPAGSSHCASAGSGTALPGDELVFRAINVDGAPVDVLFSWHSTPAPAP